MSKLKKLKLKKLDKMQNIQKNTHSLLWQQSSYYKRTKSNDAVKANKVKRMRRKKKSGKRRKGE